MFGARAITEVAAFVVIVDGDAGVAPQAVAERRASAVHREIRLRELLSLETAPLVAARHAHPGPTRRADSHSGPRPILERLFLDDAVIGRGRNRVSESG